ncbi:hypothetical protein FF011L_04650 [Roseimaritima multifibrata]|uniref:Uncharacterized protein n=1 Tax=Roseimaritima multifibrata TaxID=1930274 RepID=A0A517MA16_9BACT|nr:hypothetical protein [Roseimaritima multifibrata]QDS91732.1 hypothetical protein FF011L_04650 [Roseimaritima multifibrata]
MLLFRFAALTLAAAVLFPLATPAFADDSDDHQHMLEEHAAAKQQHAAWLAKAEKMKVDHRKALAAMARLEAEILDHEAELEEQISKIRVHEMLIEAHESSIAAHEAGDDVDHEKLSKQHQQIHRQHEQMEKGMSATTDDHADLIGQLMKFLKNHTKKFHAHGSGE